MCRGCTRRWFKVLIMSEKEIEKNIDTKKNVEEAKGKEEKTEVKKSFTKRKTFGRRWKGREREKKEFDQKIINIRRVTRVVAGGRRFSFSVAIVIGDKKGRVGVGLGKAGDTSAAIAKSIDNAKKNLITVLRTEGNSIPHKTNAKYCASKIFIQPVKNDTLTAGSSVRNVLELAGIVGVNAKVISRSKNKLNNAKATIKALKQIEK